MRAINSALKPLGRHCFYVITTASTLTDADRQRLQEREGSDHVESPLPYDVLLGRAGFRDVEIVDVTDRYIETLHAWKREWIAESDALTVLLGEEEFERRIGNRTYDIAHAEDGLTKRYRCFGIKP